MVKFSFGRRSIVAKSSLQKPVTDVGVDTFEFWIPERRPSGKNLAIALDPPLAAFAPRSVLTGPVRPTDQPNAWIAALDDAVAALTLAWEKTQTLVRVEIFFDTDYDHAMESVQWGHPERAMPFCVKHYRLSDGAGRTITEGQDNHQTRVVHRFESDVVTDRLVLECLSQNGPAPAAVFKILCYGK
jgi:hypothetical protein